MKSNVFEKEEYLTLRKDIEAHTTELGQLERNCILASAVIYAWLANDSGGLPLERLGWCIPILFSVFGAIRSLSLGLHIIRVGKYIRLIEAKALAGLMSPRGWENYLKNGNRGFRVLGDASIWTVFIGITMVVGLVGSGLVELPDSVARWLRSPVCE